MLTNEENYIQAILSHVGPEAIWKRELPIGKSRADLVVFEDNGMTIYEVKSSSDTLKRLSSQVSDYLKVCASVIVVTCTEHIVDLTALGYPVGIQLLDISGALTRLANSPNNIHRYFDYRTMYGLLRKKERLSILQQTVGAVNTPPAFEYEGNLCQFSKLPVEVAYELSVQQLSNRYKPTTQIKP